MPDEKPAGSTTNGSRGEPLNRALGRASDAPLRTNNRLTLLRNGPEAFDEWLEEIGRAEKWVHLELFQFEGDRTGRRFAEAITQKAREGVHVRVLYDWLGSFMVPRSFWRELRRAGVEVRVVNSPAPSSPLRMFERDHRKLLAVVGLYASAGGVSVADLWLERSSETGLPYRDTSVGVRGPAVADLERAFAGVWDLSGSSLPREELPVAAEIPKAGDQDVRVIVQEPGKMRVLRTLELLTSTVEKRIWIADAYFLSMTTLTRGLLGYGFLLVLPDNRGKIVRCPFRKAHQETAIGRPRLPFRAAFRRCYFSIRYGAWWSGRRTFERKLPYYPSPTSSSEKRDVALKKRRGVRRVSAPLSRRRPAPGPSPSPAGHHRSCRP